jgi:Zn-dependent protease
LRRGAYSSDVAFKLFTVRGIPIRLHVTLLAMFALLIATLGIGAGVTTGFLLFGSVLLHELGHSLVAQRFGIRIASIDLHLMGGMALMTRPPRNAREEILIAAAGPLVSLLLGLAFFAAAFALGAPTAWPSLAYAPAYVNIAMCVFNLIPALPMDGGRIFRAALSMRFGPLRATRIAAAVSRSFAVIFMIAGMLNHWWSLCVISVLLFFMVGNEERIAEAQEAMRVHRPLVVDQDPSGETREDFVDPYGRRWVVITRLTP